MYTIRIDLQSEHPLSRTGCIDRNRVSRRPLSPILPVWNKNRSLVGSRGRADRSVYACCPSWYDGKGRHLLFRLLSARFRESFVPRIAPLLFSGNGGNHLRPYRWRFNTHQPIIPIITMPELFNIFPICSHYIVLS